MLAIELQFPTGRYHATPWGNHVNEGLVEWPPSPWRLLRALVATWYLKTHDDIDETTMCRLVEGLAAELPRYDLPLGQPAHTRHYMPPYSGNTTKVFDAFVHVGEAPVYVVWPELELDVDTRAALEKLLSRLSYLGRAESWVEARLAMDDAAMSCSVVPAEPTSSGEDAELVRTLAPLDMAGLQAWYHSWEDRRVFEALEVERAKRAAKGKPTDGLTLSKSKRAKAIEDLPTSVFEALHADTSALRRRGWSQPPGSRWVTYRRPHGLLSVRQPPPRRRRSGGLPTVARFTVASDVPPRITEALRIGEKLRRCMLAHLGRREDQLEVFVGRDAKGEPLQGHEHVHILLEPNGSHGRVTHISLFARMGFDDRARSVLNGLRKVWRKDGHHLQLVLVGLGQPVDVGGSDFGAGQSPLFDRADRWVSLTPFVSTRHLHRRELRDPALAWQAMETEIRRRLEQQGFPELRNIQTVQACGLNDVTIPWRHFTTRRIHGDGRRGNAPVLGLRLEFAEEVEGPICIGYGSHFGLGSFVPDGAYR